MLWHLHNTSIDGQYKNNLELSIIFCQCYLKKTNSANLVFVHQAFFRLLETLELRSKARIATWHQQNGRKHLPQDQ